MKKRGFQFVYTVLFFCCMSGNLFTMNELPETKKKKESGFFDSIFSILAISSANKEDNLFQDQPLVKGLEQLEKDKHKETKEEKEWKKKVKWDQKKLNI